jgi:hypothetical protein
MARVFETDVVLNTQRELRLADADSSAYVGFKAPATITSNRVWTLPAADGTNGQVLSTNGSGVLSWATTSGGGLTHFVESESTSAPNATVPVDALTATDASYTNIDVALVAKGTGAILAQVPTSTAAGGNKRGLNAVDWQKVRGSGSQVASGTESVICGGSSNQATAEGSAAISGNLNYSNGMYAVVAGGQSHVASANYSCIGGGYGNTATAVYSGVSGGRLNTASQNYAFIASGNANVASGVYSFIGGGANHAASGDSSVIAGGRYGTTRGIAGNHVFPACDVPISSAVGVSQAGLLILGRTTTDATATVLASNNLSVGTTNQVVLPNNAAYSFSGEVIAGVTGGGNTARWTIAGAIKRGANAASTAMVGTPTVTMTHNDAGASAWVVAVTADTTNGGIKVQVTGAASTTIRWVCKIETTEMTF